MQVQVLTTPALKSIPGRIYGLQVLCKACRAKFSDYVPMEPQDVGIQKSFEGSLLRIPKPYKTIGHDPLTIIGYNP